MSKPIQTVEELDAVLHWRGKHAQAIRERDALRNEVGQVKGEYDRAVNKIDALQERLTEADERADSFDRLYTSSLDERDQLQQRADVLEGLLLQTNELLYAIQGDPGAVPSSSIDSMRGRVFEALKRDRSTSVLHPQNL